MTERDKFINELKSKYSNNLTSNGSTSQRDEFINSLKSKYQPTQEKVSQPSSLSVDDVKSTTLPTGQNALEQLANELALENQSKALPNQTQPINQTPQLPINANFTYNPINQYSQRLEYSKPTFDTSYKPTFDSNYKLPSKNYDADRIAKASEVISNIPRDLGAIASNTVKGAVGKSVLGLSDWLMETGDRLIGEPLGSLGDNISGMIVQKRLENAGVSKDEANKIVSEQIKPQWQESRKTSQQKAEDNIGNLQNKLDESIYNTVMSTSNPVARKVAEIAPSAGQSLASAVIGLVNPALGVSTFGASSAGNYYRDKLNEGWEADKAYAYGNIMGTFEALTEAIPLGNYIDAIKTTGISQAIGKFGLSTLYEAFQEAIMEPIDTATSQIINKDYNKQEWKDIGYRMLESGIDGALLSLLMGGAGAGLKGSISVIDNVMNGKTVSSAEIQTALDEIKANEAKVDEVMNNELEKNKENKIAIENQNKTLSNQTQQNVSTEAENQAIMSNMKNVNDKFNEVETLSQNYGENGAKQFINSYNQEKDPVNYNRAFQTAYISGRYGQDLNEQIKRYPFIADELDSETLMKAYESGINDAKIEEEITSRNLNNKNTGLIENEYTKNMNPKLKNNINSLGKIVGMPIELYFEENSDVNGEFKGDKIRLNVNGTKPLLYTLGHEIGHQLKLTDRKAYRELQNAIITNILNNNAYGFETAFADLKTRYDEKMAEVERGNLNYDEVMEEITSDAIGQILDNETTINQLVNENPTLWQKVKDIFEEILNKIRNLYGKGYSEYRYDSSKGYMSNLLDPTQLEEAISKLDKALKSTQEKLGTKSESSTETKYSSAGINAKTADKLKLETAKNLYKNGMSQQTIFEQTGWYKGADNKWKFEISTKDVAFHNPYRFIDSVEFGENKELAESTVYKLPELMKYDDLYKAYPFLKKVNIRFFKGDARHGGYVDSDGKYDIFLNSKIFSWDYREENYQYGDMYQGKGWGETLLHEVQHLIQHKEGFLPGSNMNHFLDKVTDEELSRAVKEEGIEENENIPDDVVEDMIEGIRRRLAFEKYQNTAGEAEAREVGTRFDHNKRGFDIDKRVPYTNVENKGKFEKYTKEKGKYKYSLSEDSQGNKLSKEQQEFFKDSKLKNNDGKLLVMYHSTPENFTKFDDKKLGENTFYGNTAYGHFITNNKVFSERFKDIENKGKNGYTMELYANVKKPITFPLNAHYKYNIEECNKIVEDWFIAIGEKEGLNAIKESGAEDGLGLYDSYMSWFQYDTDDLFEGAEHDKKKLVNKGYDAVEFVEGTEDILVDGSENKEPVVSYAVFNSNQLKNIDNLNPTASDDIRYSLSEDNQGRKLSEKQQEYFKNVSNEVIDNEGKLKNYYHGTTNPNFTVFDSKYSKVLGYFFSDSKNVAESYTNFSNKSKEIVNPYNTFKFKDIKEVNDFFENDDSFKKHEWYSKSRVLKLDENLINELKKQKFAYMDVNLDDFIGKYGIVTYIEGKPKLNALRNYELYDNYLVGDSEEILEASLKFINNRENILPGIYNVYLKVENPLVIDAKGNTFDKIEFEGNTYTLNKFTDNENKLLKIAQSRGYDSLVINNVVDFGGRNYSEEALEPHQDIIVFNSNQIKTVQNTNPTESDDIRYSLSENIQVEKPKKELTSEQKIAKLEKQVNKLKQQTQLTKGLVKDDKAIREYARELIEANGSEANSDKVYNDLKELYSMQSEVLKGKASKEQLLNISNKSSEIVDEILSKSYLTSDVEETYSDVAKRLRNTPIKVSEELKNSISDYNEFRKQNFGKLRLKNDEGMGIDSVYQELSQDYPWLFPEDISSAEDRLYVISEFVNNKPKSIAVSDMTDYEQIREDLSSEIFNSYNDMKSIETYADKIKTYYEEKLDNTKLLQQWINALDKKSMQDKMALQKKQYQEKIKEIKYTDKERQDMKLLEQKIKQSERIKSVYDKKLIQAEKKKIQRNVKELDTMLRKPTITKHIPQELRTSVADFLANIDFTTDKQKAQKVMQIKALKQIYQNIAQTSEFGANSDITTQILTLAEDLEGKRVVDMNREEIQLLSTLVKNVKHTVSNTNKVFIDGKYQDTSVKAKELLNDLVKKKTNTDNKIIYGLKNTFELGELKPITFFRKLGNSFVSNIYNDLRQGQNKNVDNITKIQDYLKNVIPNDMKAEIGNAKPTTYQLSNGIIDLTKQQLMSLYLLNKREQAQGHIYGLGIIQGTTKYKDGLKDVTINEKDIALKVTEEDVNKLLSNLSEREKKIADDISIFLNTTAKEFVNEASMKLYGFEIANEEDYFPIQTKKSFFDDSFDTYTADPTITSWSALKQTKENSSSPIVINNIFDVVSSHLSKSSVYNSFAVPMDNIKRLMNYRDTNGNRIIEAEMNRAYGKGAYDYIKKLMADLQGGVKYEGGVEFLDTVVKNTKIARLGLNLRVAVQQFSAYPRALAVLDESDMLKALAKNTRSWNEVLDKSQTARWKEWGYYNADVGRSMENLIFDKHDLTDLYFYSPQKSDSMTWHRLYSATEYNIRKNHPNVEVGSDEYFKLVNDKFDEVIDRTQVIDTTLNRSQNMRKKDTTWKITTAFRSEPTVSENLILDSYYQYQNAKTPSEKKKALNTVRKNVEGYAGGLIFSVLIQAIYDSLKKPQDDDEDNFLNKLLENLISEMAGQVYFGKEIYNFTQGYSSSNLQYGAIEKLFKTGTKVVEHTGSIIEGKESSYTNIGLLKDIITSTSEVAGIPAGNVIKGVENSVNNIASATKNTYVEYEGLKLTKNIKYDSNRKYFYDKLFKAYMNGTKSGDMEEAIKIYNDMLANGFKEDSINNSITSRLTKKVQLEPEMEKLVDEYAKNGQTEKFTTLVQDLTNKGYSIETIEKGYLKYTKQEAEAKVYTPKEIYKEFKKGNIEKANEMYESSIEAGSDIDSMNKALELLQNNK